MMEGRGRRHHRIRRVGYFRVLRLEFFVSSSLLAFLCNIRELVTLKSVEGGCEEYQPTERSI
jgi:hypothetical protein